MTGHAALPVVDRGFDAVRPPDPKLVADCVHCGFCLPACPTYALWGQEMDSPRGRIHLIGLVQRGEAALDGEVEQHFDRCLGCLACMPACPSGVRYDLLLEATRAQIERRRRTPWSTRLILAVIQHRGLLRLAVAAGELARRVGLVGWFARRRSASAITQAARRRSASAITQAARLIVPVRWRDVGTALAPTYPARGQARLRVGLLAGCVQSVVFRSVNEATVRVLQAEGAEVVVPPSAGCCGALAGHSGLDEPARERARALIRAFEDTEVDHVVVNAAGCGSAIKGYGHLLADDPAWAGRAAALATKAVDVLELLDRIGPRAPRGPVRARVAYHDACHLSHGQGITRAPRDLLRAIPELELLELAEPDLCCGSAGLYNLVQPEAAEALGRRKAEHIEAAGPEVVAAANPGCLLQLRRHAHRQDGLSFVHPVELIDRSICAGEDESRLPIGDQRGTKPTRPEGGDEAVKRARR